MSHGSIRQRRRQDLPAPRAVSGRIFLEGPHRNHHGLACRPTTRSAIIRSPSSGLLIVRPEPNGRRRVDCRYACDATLARPVLIHHEETLRSEPTVAAKPLETLIFRDIF